MIAQKQYYEQQGITEILHTKVAHPRLRVPFVRREALLKRLSQAVERRLILVSAPAGFGKTHLIS